MVRGSRLGENTSHSRRRSPVRVFFTVSRSFTRLPVRNQGHRAVSRRVAASPFRQRPRAGSGPERDSSNRSRSIPGRERTRENRGSSKLKKNT